MRQRRTCLSWQDGFRARNLACCKSGLYENSLLKKKVSCCMFPCNPASRIICNLLVFSLKYNSSCRFRWLLLGEAAGRKRWGSVCLVQGDLFRFYCAIGQSAGLFCQIDKGNGKQFSKLQLIQPPIFYRLNCCEMSLKFAATCITVKSK